MTGPKSPNPIVEWLSSARDTFRDACSSLVSISFDDSRALRREYAATNPRFRYISIRLRGSSTIGSLCAAFEFSLSCTRYSQNRRKKDTRSLCFLAVRLILELDTYYAHRVICRGACAFSFNQIFGGNVEKIRVERFSTTRRNARKTRASSRATDRVRGREARGRAAEYGVFWTQIDRSLSGSRHVTGQRPVCMG